MGCDLPLWGGAFELMIKVPELAASAAGDEAARGEDEVSKNLCITDYELTLSTSCRGSRGFTRADSLATPLPERGRR